MSYFNRQSLQNRSVGAALMSDLGPGMHPRISIRGGQFALVDGEGNRYGAPCILTNTPQGQKMQMLAIIVGANPRKSRIFFEHPYDQENPGPPDCFSDNGVAPSMAANSPQARTCAECHWSKWGSDQSKLTGKKTKACSEKKKLAIIVVGDTAGHTYEMQVPPATLKNLGKYAAQVASAQVPGGGRQAEPSDFITAVSFQSGQTGILEFEAHAWGHCATVDEAGAVRVAYDAGMNPVTSPDEGASVGAMIDEIWESGELDEILGLKDTPWQPPNGFIGGGMMTGQGSQTYQPTGHVAGQGVNAKTEHGVAKLPLPRTDPYAPTNGAAPAQPVRAFQPQGQPANPPQPATQPQPPAPVPHSGVPAAASPPKRRGRPAAGVSTPAVSQTVIPPTAPVQETDIPPFLRRSHQAAGPSPAPMAQSGPATANFGMVSPPPPTGGIQAALDTAFNLPTGKGG